MHSPQLDWLITAKCSGVRKRDIKLEGELKEVKGVELTYRVAELDFKVGGTIPRDVDNVVSFLERYKALA